MAHTNIQIPINGGYQRDLPDDLQIILLQEEVKYWRKKATYYASELANIPDAIEEYGYITIGSVKLMREAEHEA